MISKVIYLTKKEALATVYPTDCVLISFIDPLEEPIAFKNIEPEKVVSVACTSALFPSEGVVFTPAQAEAIATLIRNSTANTAYVHCTFGEQRSASCAMAIADFFQAKLFENTTKTDTNRSAPSSRIYGLTYEALCDIIDD